jgi:hypothetical protein
LRHFNNFISAACCLDARFDALFGEEISDYPAFALMIGCAGRGVENNRDGRCDGVLLLV